MTSYLTRLEAVIAESSNQPLPLNVLTKIQAIPGNFGNILSGTASTVTGTLVAPTPPTPPSNPNNAAAEQTYQQQLAAYNTQSQAYNTQQMNLVMQRMTAAMQQQSISNSTQSLAPQSGNSGSSQPQSLLLMD